MRVQFMAIGMFLLAFWNCQSGESAVEPLVQKESKVVEADLDPAFLSVLERFLQATWWERNFNSLVLNEDEDLAPYLDSKHDLQRIHWLKNSIVLSSREQTFGFEAYCDLKYQPELNAPLKFEKWEEGLNLCDLKDEYTIYYTEKASLPEVVLDRETMEIDRLPNPYGNTQVNVVYLISRNNRPKVLYFIETPTQEWKLIYMDDTKCES